MLPMVRTGKLHGAQPHRSDVTSPIRITVICMDCTLDLDYARLNRELPRERGVTLFTMRAHSTPSSNPSSESGSTSKSIYFITLL